MPLGLGLLVVLAAVWAAVLLPSLVRSRVLSSPIEGVRNFEVAMGILAGNKTRRGGNNATGRWVMVPKEVTAPARRRTRVIQRRRKTFQRLVSFSLVTLVAGIVPATRWMLLVHLLADAALGLYAWRLRQIKREGELPAAVTPAADPVTSVVVSSRRVTAPSAPPTPHAEPAEIAEDAEDDPIVRLITRTG